MTTAKQAGWPTRIWAAVGGGLIALVGLALMGGGGWLIYLDGSPYYFLAGSGVMASGVLLIRRNPAAGLVYAAVLAVTLAWAIWESGLVYWSLSPRLVAPAVLGLFLLLVLPATRKTGVRRQAAAATALASVACFAALGLSIPDTFTQGQAVAPAQVQDGAPPAQATSDWRYYGRDPGGSRYTPVDQINRENVDKLKVAWTFRSGEKENRGSEDQNTPMQVGDKVYVCTPTNVVIALNADTGQEVWRYDPKVKPGFWNRCRGVGYWDGTQPKATTKPAAVKGGSLEKVVTKPAPIEKPALARVTPLAIAVAKAPICQRRIITSTINAELLALDAETGAPCPGFGTGGKVSLTTGIGPIKKGFYFQTSMPTVIGDRVIIGGWVADNQEIAEPAGVVRAFDAVTGELVWAIRRSQSYRGKARPTRAVRPTSGRHPPLIRNWVWSTCPRATPRRTTGVRTDPCSASSTPRPWWRWILRRGRSVGCSRPSITMSGTMMFPPNRC